MYLYYMAIAVVFLILGILCAHRTNKKRYFFLIDFSSTYILLTISEIVGIGNSGLYLVALFNCLAVMIDVVFCNALISKGYHQTETFIFNCMPHHGCIGIVTGLLSIGLNLL